MKERLAPRPSPTAALFTISAALLLPLPALLFLSKSPAAAAAAFLLGPLSNTFYMGNTLTAASLLALTGLGTALAFQAGLFSLGGEGQLYGGMLAAAFLAPFLPPELSAAGMILLLAAAMLSGALPGALTAILKAAAGIDELLSSFLISAAMIPVIDALIAGPLRDPAANLLATKSLDTAFRLERWLPPSSLGVLFPISLMLMLAASLFFYRTRRGYLWRISGRGAALRRHAGISEWQRTLLPLTASGALHGLAGGFLVLGTHYAAVQGGSAGLGWNGIAVALIARLDPRLIFPAALFFAWITQGAEAARLQAGLALEMGGFVQALVLLLVTLQFVPLLKEKR